MNTSHATIALLATALTTSCVVEEQLAETDRAVTGTSQIGEAGSHVTNQPDVSTWHLVQLDADYLQPVVFAQLVTHAGHDSSHVRVRNVTGNSFEFQIEEWANGVHSHVEQIDYVVLEEGVHTLEDGRVLEVGRAQVDHDFAVVDFAQPMASTPVVISQSQTLAGNRAIVTRQRYISATGFEVRVQEDEAADGIHAIETVGYLAVAEGQSASAVVAVEYDVDESWKGVLFPNAMTEQPYMLVAMQTFNGADPAALRMRSLDQLGFDVHVDEEKLFDSETAHAMENVGYVGLLTDANGAIHADDALAACSSDPIATITYGSSTYTYESTVEEVLPGYCMRLNYGGSGLWTTLDEAGGLSCDGSNLMVEYNDANSAFNSFHMTNHAPAACGAPIACPTTPPPTQTGSLMMYYGTTTDMYPVNIMNFSNGCYKVSYGGSPLWFPESALDYRCNILGNPLGLDYNQRRYSPCTQ